jgi:DNA-binding MarR family transcriptional regulator
MSAQHGLEAAQLRAYFALMEVTGLLTHRVEQQLRDESGITYIQFQILARLADQSSGRLRMTDLADGVVHSRSGLTYQVGLLERAGLVRREPTPQDERSVTVQLTDAGRDCVARVMPGHVAVVREALLDPLSREDVAALDDVLGRVRDAMRCGPPPSARRRRGG